MHDPLTYRYKRTTMDAFGCSADEAIAVRLYKPPLHRRFFYALCRHGWVIVPIVLAAAVLSGCQSDIDDAIAVHADIADAVAMAAKEAGK